MFTYCLLDALVIIGFIVAVGRKYRSYLNPVTLYGMFFFVAVVIGTSAFRATGMLDVPLEIIDRCLIYSGVSFGAFGFAYLIQASPFRPILSSLRRISRPFCVRAGSDATKAGIPILALEFAFVYLLLMITSGAGTLWITAPREAYQRYRAGVGVLWSLSTALLFFIYFVYLVRHGNSVRRVMGASLAMSVAAYFLGSKGTILAFMLLGMFYVHYHLRRVSNRTILFACGAAGIVFVGLQLAQGTADSLFSTLLYFDYLPNTARFLDSKFFAFQYGRVTLSELWFYVPRALYHAKPYAYGQVMISDWLYPGIARSDGATPALIGWTISYTDFGIPGIISDGLISAWISKAAFESFIEERSIDTLAIAAQAAFLVGVSMFPNGPFPIFWYLFMTQSGLFWIVKQAATLHSQPEAVRDPATTPAL